MQRAKSPASPCARQSPGEHRVAPGTAIQTNADFLNDVGMAPKVRGGLASPTPA